MDEKNTEFSENSPNDEDNDAKDRDEYEYVPPDGGWGWLVLGGSVLVSLLIPGTIKSFGILFVEFLEVFHASPVAASWIPAITYFLYCSLGPLTSYLSTRYSYRSVTLLGGVFAATGMISSVFATSITHLYICQGVLLGIGAGLSYPPGVFIVTSYFVRLRGLANGVAVSGSALGSIILPPFLRFLLEHYGYRGAVLIMGGLILNVLVGALLYDPVEQHLKKVPIDSKKNGKHNGTKEVNNATIVQKKRVNIKNPDSSALLDNSIFGPDEKEIIETKVRLEFYPPSPEKEYFSTVIHPLLEDDTCPELMVMNGGSYLNLSRPITNSESVQHIARKISTGSYRGKNSYSMGSTGQIPRKSSMSRPMSKVASASAITRNVSVGSNMSGSSFRYISSAFHGSTLVGLNHEFSSQQNVKTPPDHNWSHWTSVCCCCSPKSQNLEGHIKTKKGVYHSLVRDPIFFIILISNATSAIGYTNFTILLPAHAVTLGFDKDKASYLLSIVATLDLVGRIGGSALSDWLPISKNIYFIGGLLCSGISLLFLAHVNCYRSLAFFCAAFGLSSGTYVGITAVVMVDALGEDRLASSYGVSLFINGIIQLIGPPICGYAFESINSYGPIITALGLSLISGASVWICYPFVSRNRNTKNYS